MLVSSFSSYACMGEKERGREERESTHLHNMKVFVSCIGIARRCTSPSECVCECV